MIHDDDENVQVLSESDSWGVLERKSIGRLAYAVSTHPEIVPVNFVAHDHRLFFRSSGGSKLFGMTVNHNVAFEVDETEGELARSVIVHGTARRIEQEDELEFVQTLPLRPWIPADKYFYVEIEVDEITGRAFQMGPEPTE